jgi:hypothetical protein
MLRWIRVKPVSPEILALAGLWTLLLEAVLAGLLLLILVDRIAPPQDLPWKPFSLNQPIGLATAGKLSRIASDPAACRAALRAGGLTVVDQPEKDDGFCSTRDTVRASGKLSPAAPVMTCSMALRYALWERQVVAPAAQARLGQAVVRVDHLGTYACRTIYGRPGERPSEHARANALDIAGFRLADGRRITVARDFRRETQEGRFVRAVRDGSCRVFGVVLSPDYNAAHADHLHLDAGRWTRCG